METTKITLCLCVNSSFLSAKTPPSVGASVVSLTRLWLEDSSSPEDGGGGRRGVAGRRGATQAGDLPPARRLSHCGKHDRLGHLRLTQGESLGEPSGTQPNVKLQLTQFLVHPSGGAVPHRFLWPLAGGVGYRRDILCVRSAVLC